MVIPASFPMVLPAPSQPSTTCPVNDVRVAGDAGVHPHGISGERTQRAVHPGYLGSAVEADQRVLLDPCEHELFQVGLVEHVRLREAVRAGLLVAAELGHHAVPGV